MRKLITFIIVILTTLNFFACNSSQRITTLDIQATSITSSVNTDSNTISVLDTELTTFSRLSTPINVQVIDNVITFDPVLFAQKYRLVIYSQSDNYFGEYEINSGEDLSSILIEGLYSYQLYAIANDYLDSEKTIKTNFEIIGLNQVKVIEGSEMNNLEYIRWFGRNYFDQIENAKYFYFTASGFEIAFYGTELKATFLADNYEDLDKQAYLVVLLDNEADPTKGTTLVLDQAEAEYVLVEGLDYGYHTVKLLKRSEASDSNTALKQILTDGYFTNPPESKDFNIQFIAASSSTGYGNLGNLSDNKTTANSDGLRAFAYLTTYLLDAEISIFAASGWGVSRGYNTLGNISEIENIPKAFEYIAIDSSNTVFQAAGKWNQEDFIPDVIVVNLGTNDFNSSNYYAMGTLDKIDIEHRFWIDYTNFLVLLHQMYPNAYIIVAYGLMNESALLKDITLEIINEANLLIGETKVFSFEMEGAGTLDNPYGSNYHPNVKTSKNVANSLAEFISDLTGREIVREIFE